MTSHVLYQFTMYAENARKRRASYDLVTTYKRPRPVFIGPIRGGRNPTAFQRNRNVNVYRAGTSRVGGFYGRYGRAARDRGLIPEKKFFDTALSFAIDATGEVPATGQLALIPQGDTETTRDGRQCTIKSITIRGVFEYVPGAGSLGQHIVYMCLVQDTQTNGAAAAITDVFSSNNMSTNMHNLANSSRFIIIKRWEVQVRSNAGVATAYSGDAKQIKYHKRCNIPMEYSSTAGAITEIKSNNLFLVAGSYFGDDLTTFNGTCRLRFMG